MITELHSYTITYDEPLYKECKKALLDKDYKLKRSDTFSETYAYEKTYTIRIKEEEAE